MEEVFKKIDKYIYSSKKIEKDFLKVKLNKNTIKLLKALAEYYGMTLNTLVNIIIVSGLSEVDKQVINKILDKLYKIDKKTNVSPIIYNNRNRK